MPFIPSIQCTGPLIHWEPRNSTPSTRRITFHSTTRQLQHQNQHPSASLASPNENRPASCSPWAHHHNQGSLPLRRDNVDKRYASKRLGPRLLQVCCTSCPSTILFLPYAPTYRPSTMSQNELLPRTLCYVVTQTASAHGDPPFGPRVTHVDT